MPAVPKPKADTSIWAYHAKWKALYAHRHSESYLRKFDGIKTWLERYCPDLRMEQLDKEWVQVYIACMLNTPSLRTGKVPRTGTIGKHLGFFKAMLKFTRLPHDWLVNNYTENTPGTDLRYEEVLAVYQHEYLFDELRATADQYVLLTQLGMRYGDWLRFTEKHVQSFLLNGSPRLICLDFRQGKTKEPVMVAFSDLAEEIWHRYLGQFEKVANQTFNERLKFVGARRRPDPAGEPDQGERQGLHHNLRAGGPRGTPRLVCCAKPRATTSSPSTRSATPAGGPPTFTPTPSS